ncbi:MAG: hypothetical protein H6Q37_568 [Chloroflexi bacterium]|nr:hypothetical protein [Chloroflexota bacterium]
MRSKILVSLGLTTLLLLTACSPALLNKLGKSSLFTKSILVRPSATTTSPTIPPEEEQVLPKALQPGSILLNTDTPLPEPSAIPPPQEGDSQPASSPAVGEMTETPMLLSTSTPVAIATAIPITPTNLMVEQPSTATPVNAMPPAKSTLVAPPSVLASLAHLFQVDPTRLVISDLEAVSWSSLCFDFPRGNPMACNQITTPGLQGRVLVIKKMFGGDPVYAFRSDADGELIYTLPAAALAARDLLSGTAGLLPEDIRFILVEKWDWPNTCAMTPAPLPKDALCITVPLPGWRVVLSANEMIYEYHTDVNGEVVQPSLP